jgi:hypothetical protein
MYCGDIESLGYIFAEKLGLHPSTLAPMISHSSNLPK